MDRQGAREGSRAALSPQLQPEQLDCGAAHLQHPLTILQPLRASPVFRAPGLTAVAVANANNYTAVFLGTATGRLLKVSMRDWSSLGWATEGQSHSAFFSFPSRPPQWLVTREGSGLSDVCLCFRHLPAWGSADSVFTFAVYLLPQGLCFPSGCSCWGTSMRDTTALLAITSGVQCLD